MDDDREVQERANSAFGKSPALVTPSGAKSSKAGFQTFHLLLFALFSLVAGALLQISQMKGDLAAVAEV